MDCLPFAVQTLVRIYFLKLRLGLTDLAMKEAQRDGPLYCRFA